MLALQDRFSDAWAFLNTLEQPGFVDPSSKHISELYLLAYLAMSHPDDAVLASVPSVMDVMRSRSVRPEWASRVEVLHEQMMELLEGKARPPSASDLVRMRPQASKPVHVDAFAFSVKVRNEAETCVDLTASGLVRPFTAFIKIFQLDIEVIFSKDPFLVAGRDSTIAAGSMFAAVAPHVVIEEIMEPSVGAAGAATATCSKSVILPTLKSSSCFFLAVECNGVKTSQTVFKRCPCIARAVRRTYNAASRTRSRMTIACAEQLGVITVKYSLCSAAVIPWRVPQLIRVRSDAASCIPARNAYVKVYIKLKNGRIEFYKDGYTDRRGKFDYVSLNTGQMQQASDIAILVCCADGDCNVARANPPAGI